MRRRISNEAAQLQDPYAAYERRRDGTSREAYAVRDLPRGGQERMAMGYAEGGVPRSGTPGASASPGGGKDGIEIPTLQAVIRDLVANPDLAREMQVAPDRTLKKLPYLTERDRRTLKTADGGALESLAAAAQKYAQAAKELGPAGSGRQKDPAEELGKVGPGGAEAPFGWGGVAGLRPDGSGGLSRGQLGGMGVPVRPGSGQGGGGQGGASGPSSWGGLGRGRGTAMGIPGTGAASDFGWLGGIGGGSGPSYGPDGFLGGAIQDFLPKGYGSGAQLPGGVRDVIFPGESRTDDPRAERIANEKREGADFGTKVGFFGGAILGGIEGGVWGLAIGAVAGAIVGNLAGTAYGQWHATKDDIVPRHRPAEDGSGPTGPRSTGSRPADDSAGPVGPRVRERPADDGSGPTGPRSGGLRPADDGNGPVGPRSRGARLEGFNQAKQLGEQSGMANDLWRPNPEDPKSGSGGPRAAATKALDNLTSSTALLLASRVTSR